MAAAESRIVLDGFTLARVNSLKGTILTIPLPAAGTGVGSIPEEMARIMATNPEGYDILMADLATSGTIVVASVHAEHPPLVDLEALPAHASPAPPQPEATPAIPAPVPRELDRFFQLPVEQRPEASSTDQPAEEARATLPEWAWAALLAGCAEMGERRRREDEERRARERKERAQG